MPRYCPRCGESLHSHGTTKGELRKTARRAYEPVKKATRKVSAYQKKVGVAMKQLRKAHTKKNGDFKKGWDMRRIMSTAHKKAKRK